jgi:Ran GTPase-activating protein (RanGAP) involved in mRNA processing and transport
LGEGLKQNQTVKELHLTHNQIGDQGAAGLGEGLKQNQTLKTLDLRYNQIGDAQKAELKRVKNASLTNLRL